MYNKYFIVLCILSMFSIFLSGCIEEVEPNLVWSGVLVDAGVNSSGSSWITLNNSSVGVYTKILPQSYPVFDDLVEGSFYSLNLYVKLGVDGNYIVKPMLVSILDSSGGVVWP